MADKLQIEVEIGLDGKVKLETHGFKGQSCFAETASIEKALGKVVEREKSSEYYQKESATTKVRSR